MHTNNLPPHWYLLGSEDTLSLAQSFYKDWTHGDIHTLANRHIMGLISI